MQDLTSQLISSLNLFKYILPILILAFSTQLLAQNTLSPTVIGSQGKTVTGSSGNSLQYTVGEAVILTSSSTNHIVTQGFNQLRSLLFSNPLEVYYTVLDASCIGITDGAIVIDSVTGCDSNYTVLLKGSSVIIGDTISDLLSGDYVLDISTTDGCSLNETITINVIGTECDIHFYNAFSPNGDLTNDTWEIELVESYPDNNIMIYDRWGVLAWEGTGYDNVNVVWDGKNTHGAELPDGTYYYIFQSNDLVIKGYVEITR